MKSSLNGKCSKMGGGIASGITKPQRSQRNEAPREEPIMASFSSSASAPSENEFITSKGAKVTELSSFRFNDDDDGQHDGWTDGSRDKFHPRLYLISASVEHA